MANKYSQTINPVEARYQRAWQLEQASRPLTAKPEKFTFNTTVYPCWIKDSDCFWYERETKAGKEYRLVDASAGTNSAAFNHQALAKALAKTCGKKIDAQDLPLDGVTISLSPRQVTFTAYDQHWLFDNTNETLSKTTDYSSDEKRSPDGRYAAFTRAHNIWVRDLNTGEERALTQDGQQLYAYATTTTVYGRQEIETVELLWSPDSKRLFTQARDTRQVRKAPPLVQHVPPDGSVQPQLLHEDRRVGVPGDQQVEVNHFLAIEVSSGEIQSADYPGCTIFYPPYVGFFSGHRGWWSGDSRRAYFIELAAGGLSGRLVEFDTHTGATRVLIDDRSDSHFIFIPNSHLCPLTQPLADRDEVIWYSERSGWAHLYLYDLATGTLKHPITAGEWLVRNILHYDAGRRELWIQTAGRLAGRNPYYCDICRVNIDSGELTPVVSSEHEYVVREQRSRTGRANTTGLDGATARGVSPCGQYVVTTCSRADTMPVSLLLNRTGKEILKLEAGEVPALPTGWQWPEPVMVKAADGKTDLYAVVYRPSDFSADKSYPVLDFSHGDFAPAGSFTNTLTKNYFYLSPAATAELGFIVVMINSRGTGLRSKAFFTDKASSLFFSCQLPDHVAVIQQLAERYPYMDRERVGVGAMTSTSLAAHALLKYPDFYTVGVTRNPCLDWRLSGAFVAEMYCAGAPEDEDEEALYKLAGQLKGHLLLVHGLLDDAVPVAETLRLVEALQQANKDFDLLLMPNLGHGANPYVVRRSWDYLVKHLQGVEPPKEVELCSE